MNVDETALIHGLALPFDLWLDVFNVTAMRLELSVIAVCSCQPWR